MENKFLKNCYKIERKITIYNNDYSYSHKINNNKKNCKKLMKIMKNFNNINDITIFYKIK